MVQHKDEILLKRYRSVHGAYKVSATSHCNINAINNTTRMNESRGYPALIYLEWAYQQGVHTLPLAELSIPLIPLMPTFSLFFFLRVDNTSTQRWQYRYPVSMLADWWSVLWPLSSSSRSFSAPVLQFRHIHGTYLHGTSQS